jgi:hypothetical protein
MIIQMYNIFCFSRMETRVEKIYYALILQDMNAKSETVE